MKKFIFLAIATVFAFSACTKDKFNIEPIPSTQTFRTDTVEKNVYITINDTTYIEVPVEVRDTIYITEPGDTILVKKETSVIRKWFDCSTMISYITARTEYIPNVYPAEEKTFQFQHHAYAWGEDRKQTVVSDPATIELQGKDTIVCFNDLKFTKQDGATIISYLESTNLRQNFSQTLNSSVWAEKTRAYLVIGGDVFEFPGVTQVPRFKGYNIATTPTEPTVRAGYKTYYASFEFEVEIIGECASKTDVVNYAHLLVQVCEDCTKEKCRWVSRYWEPITKTKGETSAYLVILYTDGRKDSTELGKFPVVYDPELASCDCIYTCSVNSIEKIDARFLARECIGTETYIGDGNYKCRTRNGIVTGTNKKSFTSYVSWPTFRYEKDGISFDYLIPDNIFKEISNTLSNTSWEAPYKVRYNTSTISYGYSEAPSYRTKHSANVKFVQETK